MPPTDNAHRAEFSVRCACGIAYHTSDAHIGKLLPCKCGRTVEIVRPAESEAAQPSASAKATRREKRRRKVTKRRYVPSQFWSKFGKVGVLLDKANGAAARFVGAQLLPMFTGSFLQRAIAISAWAYLIGAFVAWMLLRYWSEETLPATIIAYGPRFLALWPLALLVLFALFFLRRALFVLAVAALIIVIPIMGFRVSVGTLGTTLPLIPAPGTIRILTFNTEGGRPLSYDLGILLKEAAPDVFTFQECGDQLWEVIEAQKGWFSKRYGTLCTGSRWEIEEAEAMPREDFARVSKFGFGGTALVLRTYINSPRGRLALVNLHLETARKGLEALLGSEGLVPDSNPFNRATNRLNGTEQPDESGISKEERFRRNTLIRETESERASRWAVSGIGNTPLLIAGDFNLPVESTIFRNHWSKFVDAFESKGNGLGWTKYEGRWLRIRIDHALSVEGGLKPLAIKILPDYQSDHRPVIVDYAWPTKSREVLK